MESRSGGGARRRFAAPYAKLRSIAVNQDGRSNGMTAPNPAAQESLLRSAYADAGIDPNAVVYVEAHGTGTKVCFIYRYILNEFC